MLSFDVFMTEWKSTSFVQSEIVLACYFDSFYVGIVYRCCLIISLPVIFLLLMYSL